MSDVFGARPVLDLLNFCFVGDAPFVGAVLSEDDNRGDTDFELLAREGGSGVLHTLQDAVDVGEVFSDETSNVGIVGDSGRGAVGELVASRRGSDRYIVAG